MLVEQNLPTAVALGNRHLILSKGEICYSGNSAELDGNETVLRDYLGVLCTFTAVVERQISRQTDGGIDLDGVVLQ